MIYQIKFWPFWFLFCLGHTILFLSSDLDCLLYLCSLPDAKLWGRWTDCLFMNLYKLLLNPKQFLKRFDRFSTLRCSSKLKVFLKSQIFRIMQSLHAFCQPHKWNSAQIPQPERFSHRFGMMMGLGLYIWLS